MSKVCNIVCKDKLNKYRKLLSVEESTDGSVYFRICSESGTKKDSTKYSYHAIQFENKFGLVQTHIEGIKDKSKRFQVPLAQRESVGILSINLGRIELSDFSEIIECEKDIKLSIRPEFLGSCDLLFYSNQKSIYNYSYNTKTLILHTYHIPCSKINNLYLGVLMNKTLVAEIRSNKHNNSLKN